MKLQVPIKIYFSQFQDNGNSYEMLFPDVLLTSFKEVEANLDFTYFGISFIQISSTLLFVNSSSDATNLIIWSLKSLSPVILSLFNINS